MDQYKSFSQAHALIIAISKYEGSNALPPIVTKDANDVVDVLTAENYCGYKRENVRTLLDSEATLSNIRSEISYLSSKVGDNDTVFIYFSGHGGYQSSKSFLVPVDFNNPIGGFLVEDELSSLLSTINSDRLLFVIDACHSAGVAGFKSSEKNITETFGFTDKSLEKLSQGRGKVLLASSRESETSLILNGDQNSLFTKHFLSALRGAASSDGDNLIRVFDIFSYLEKSVPVDAEKAGQKQHPVFKSSIENNFPVALKCGGVKQLNTTSSNISRIKRDRNLEDILSELYPAGPTDQDIWLRAGGDVSRLKLNGSGRSQWFSAIKVLKQGGGGVDISIESLCDEMRSDYPNNPDLN